jgi:2-keto-4-pentenoate hydratase
MNTVDVDVIADELLAAYASGQTVPPLTATYPGLTVDAAYAIQERQVATRTGLGASIVGFKIGLTSAAMQQQLGVDQPDYGHLLTDMVHAADTPIRLGDFLQPRVEPEVAIVLGRELRGPGLTVTDILDATAYAMPAIEIIDSRITDWRIGLEDTIADNASSGGVVFGTCPWWGASCGATDASSTPVPERPSWVRRCTRRPGWQTPSPPAVRGSARDM